jgi:NAD-dependent SIR2 family protein deacetylase
VVLFGEMVRESHAQRAAKLLRDCDVLLVLGTACDVAPAADMLRAVSARGGNVFELSLTKSMVSNVHVD